MEEKGGVLRCSEDNVAAFNVRLRAEAPEAFALAMALHKAGMLDGLLGACIAPLGSLPDQGVVPVLSDQAEARLADLHWKRGGRPA